MPGSFTYNVLSPEKAGINFNEKKSIIAINSGCEEEIITTEYLGNHQKGQNKEAKSNDEAMRYEKWEKIRKLFYFYRN